jgi:predicted membrane-bound spermidine synthase
MAKALVSTQDLALIALREIRSFPGGQHVTDVEVDGEIDKVAKTNWTAHARSGKSSAAKGPAD